MPGHAARRMPGAALRHAADGVNAPAQRRDAHVLAGDREPLGAFWEGAPQSLLGSLPRKALLGAP